MSLKHSLTSRAEQQQPALPECGKTGTGHHPLRGPDMDCIRCGKLTKTKLLQLYLEQREETPTRAELISYLCFSGWVSQSKCQTECQASTAILFLLSLGSFRGQATAVSCPCTPGQQCALSTQGGVGRAAYAAAPGSAGLAQGSSCCKRGGFLQNTKTNTLSSNVCGVHLPAIPPL